MPPLVCLLLRSTFRSRRSASHMDIAPCSQARFPAPMMRFACSGMRARRDPTFPPYAAQECSEGTWTYKAQDPSMRSAGAASSVSCVWRSCCATRCEASVRVGIKTLSSGAGFAASGEDFFLLVPAARLLPADALGFFSTFRHDRRGGGANVWFTQKRSTLRFPKAQVDVRGMLELLRSLKNIREMD